IPQQLPQGLAAVLLSATEDVQEHPVVDCEARDKALRLRLDEGAKGLFVPNDKALRRLLFDQTTLSALPRGLGLGPPVGDDVLGGLGEDVALGIEAATASAAGDLVKVSRREEPSLFFPAVLEELGEEHGPDRDVHPHAQGVRSAD